MTLKESFILSWFPCLGELISVSSDTCAHNRVCGLNRWTSSSQPDRTESCPPGYDHQTYSDLQRVIHEQILQSRRRENEQTALYIWQTPDHWFMSTGTKHYTTQSSSIFSTHFICFVFTCFSCLRFYFDYHSVSTNTIRYNNHFSNISYKIYW